MNPKDFPNRAIQDVLIEMTDGGLDYTFECIGNTLTMVSADFYLIQRHHALVNAKNRLCPFMM